MRISVFQAAVKKISLSLELVYHIFQEEIIASKKLKRGQILETLHSRQETEQPAMAQALPTKPASPWSRSQTGNIISKHGRGCGFLWLI